MPMKPYKLLLNDAFILGIILLNAVVIFISGFGIAEKPLDIVEALFTTVTNVNFDPERLAGLVRRAAWPTPASCAS